ncbi:hypothetical protein ACFO3J_33015 [Streptomyces polygonati]|uniref:NADP-dependent oxidoreductase domain-containing protein n=1 Tax=Streptomyces polygonati TaxID=1617087 RepID=A0ABV8HW11_9ACTN
MTRFGIASRDDAAEPAAADARAVLAGEAGLTLVQLAPAFVPEHPGVTSASIGPRILESSSSWTVSSARTGSH